MNFLYGTLAAVTVAVGIGSAATAYAAPPPAAGEEAAEATNSRKINFGCSVFGVPNGVTCELMRRDRILARALGDIETRHQDFEITPPIMQLIADGKMDVTSAADLPILESASRDHIRVIGLVRVGHVAVVGPKGRTLKELKGKRIGFAPGTSGHYGILRALESAALSENDVQLVALPVNKIAEALLAGEIDAFSLHEPTPSGLIAKHADRFTIMHRSLSYAYQVVSRRFAEQHPEAVPHIAAALVRAVRWMRKDRANLALAAKWMRQAARNLAGKEPAFSENDVIALTRNTLLDIREAPQLPRAGNSDHNALLAYEVDFMRKQGKLPSDARWETIRDRFDPAPMNEVLTNPKRYRIDEFDYARER